jgi:hypothetical protein
MADSELRIGTEPEEGELSLGEVVPEVALLGTHPVFLRPIDPDVRGVARRLRRVPGASAWQATAYDDLPGPVQDDDDWPEGEGGFELPNESGVYIIAALGSLVWLLWSLFRCEAITYTDLGGELSDDDVIEPHLQPGTPGFFTVTLQSVGRVRWWKDVEVRDIHNVIRASCWTQDDRREATLAVPNHELVRTALVFGKAKQFGIHALKYEMVGLTAFESQHLTLRWVKDSDW